MTGKFSGCDLLIDLSQQSRLGVLAQVELATEFFDNFLSDLTLIHCNMLNIVTAVELDFEHANRLLFELVVLASARGITRSLSLRLARDSVLSVWHLAVDRLSLGSIGRAVTLSSLRLLRLRRNGGSRNRLVLVARHAAVSSAKLLRLSRHRLVPALTSASAEGQLLSVRASLLVEGIDRAQWILNIVYSHGRSSSSHARLDVANLNVR